MEMWKEAYKGMIPKDDYNVWITQSEENGLHIELKNGEFGKEIQNMSAGFSDSSDIKHYVLITPNFNIDIVTDWKPKIKVDRI